MQVIFDMDGVLIDSRDAVWEAYAQAGVSMPESAWDKPWEDWLVKLVGNYKQAVMVHAAKNNNYEKLLGRLAKPLFPAMLAQDLVEQGHHVCVATGASKVACDIVLDFLGLRQSVRLLGTGLTLGQKKSNVRSAARHAVKNKEHTIYVDDNQQVVAEVNDLKLPHLHAINYKRNDDDFIEEFEKVWTLLSSLPEKMSALKG